MKVLIISNPTSGKASQEFVAQVQQELVTAGAEVELYLTQAANDATAYLANYSGDLDVVAVAGGDGTINEAINGLKEKDSSTFRIALIPTGTTNVLAGELKIKRNAKHISQIILQGKEKPIYPGRINDRRFLLMAGVGYDAWVVDNVDLDLKKKVGKLAYVLSMLKQLRHFGKKEYRLQVDGKEYLANSVVITNGRLYGGSFVLSKQADLSAPTTQVLMLNGKNMWSLLYSLLGLPFGLVEKMPGVVSVPAKQVHIELVSQAGSKQAQPEPVQADGDSLAHLPITVVMEAQPLRVLVP